MSFKDQLFIIRNRLFEKRNIILVIVLTIIFLILFSCLTIIQFSVENKNEMLDSRDFRTYKIYHETKKVDYDLIQIDFTEEQIDLIRNLDHVELVVSNKYQWPRRFEVSEFNIAKEDGILLIKALLEDNDVKIKNGTNLSNKYELICSNTFYPHEFDDRIYKNLFLSSDEILNKKISVISANEDLNEKEITLKIVGTYNNKYEEEANTCYTDIETYDEIASKYSSYFESYDENGNFISTEYTEYRDYLVIIDSKENVDKVLASLKDMGFEFGPISYLDSNFLDMLYFIPLFVSIIVILFTLIILYNFIAKKNINRLNNIGILKAIGYDEKTITTLTINENIVVMIISCIISLIIYFIVLNNLTYTLLAEVTYGGYILNVPYILMALFIVIFIFIIRIMVKSNFKKIFKLTIQEQLTK